MAIALVYYLLPDTRSKTDLNKIICFVKVCVRCMREILFDSHHCMPFQKDLPLEEEGGHNGAGTNWRNYFGRGSLGKGIEGKGLSCFQTSLESQNFLVVPT